VLERNRPGTIIDDVRTVDGATPARRATSLRVTRALSAAPLRDLPLGDSSLLSERNAGGYRESRNNLSSRRAQQERPRSWWITRYKNFLFSMKTLASHDAQLVTLDEITP